MYKILSLLFFAASTLNVWAADQSWVKVSEPGDLAYWVTVGNTLPSKNPDEVIYQTRRDFPDFFKVAVQTYSSLSDIHKQCRYF